MLRGPDRRKAERLLKDLISSNSDERCGKKDKGVDRTGSGREKAGQLQVEDSYANP